MIDAQKIFALSTVSGAQSRDYIEQAPNYGWTWPKRTWLERRREELRRIAKRKVKQK